MEANSWFFATILGIVQGLTEFLPVSSSGHLIVVSWLMEGKPLPLELNVALHMGTLFAVLIYFWRDWWQLSVACHERVFQRKKSFHADILLPALLIGTLPAAVVGLGAKDQIEALFHHPLAVIFPLFSVGFILWYLDRRCASGRSFESLKIRDGFLIGLAQCLALVPGVSRSGATISAARLQQVNREDAARFSFLLGTPAMGGAALLHAKDFIKSVGDPTFYLGVLVSCLVGCLAIKLFLSFIKRFGFLAFAIYRAVLALGIWWLLTGGTF